MTMLRATQGDSNQHIPVRGTTLDAVVTSRMYRMRGGLAGSLGLHLLLLAAILIWPFLSPPPPPEELAMPINLVRFAAKTTAPAAARSAPMPQQQAKEETKVEHSQNIPVPHRLPMPSAEITSPAAAAPDVLPVKKSPPDADAALAVNKAKKYTPPAKPKQPPTPTDELSKKLQELALLRQPSPPLKADPQQQNGAGLSNVTTGSANAASGKTAAYSVKDFIRAQVERRWNLSRNMVQADNWTISVHITLRRDGSVTLAEIVDDPRLRTNRVFRDFAYSARDAVILSSPLAIPPGAYEIARDIVIDFDPKRVLQ